MAKYISLAAFQSTRPAALKQWNGLKKNDLAKLLPERTVAKALNEVREKATSYKVVKSTPHMGNVTKLLNRAKKESAIRVAEEKERQKKIKAAIKRYMEEQTSK